jgi:Helitron helicase-like domain at N-terminus
VSSRQIESDLGIFGFINGYFGVVEAQGRGSLHVHMLIWLKNAPNADEMLELLSLSQFHEKVAAYINHNI